MSCFCDVCDISRPANHKFTRAASKFITVYPLGDFNERRTPENSRNFQLAVLNPVVVHQFIKGKRTFKKTRFPVRLISAEKRKKLRLGVRSLLRNRRQTRGVLWLSIPDQWYVHIAPFYDAILFRCMLNAERWITLSTVPLLCCICSSVFYLKKS